MISETTEYSTKNSKSNSHLPALKKKTKKKMEKGFKTTAQRAVSAPQVPRPGGWSLPGASSLQQTAIEATTQATILAHAFKLENPPVGFIGEDEIPVEQQMLEDRLDVLGEFENDKTRERRYALGPADLLTLFQLDRLDALGDFKENIPRERRYALGPEELMATLAEWQ